MKDYTNSIDYCKKKYSSYDEGLTEKQVLLSQKKFGKNIITEKKGKGLFGKIVEALLDPMLIILEVALVITLGVNLGKFLKTGNGDFYECFGVLFSILLSVFLTVVMEGKSQKAFKMLNTIYDNGVVKVRRNGKIEIVKREEICVGDRVLVSAGDKVCADGRLVKSISLLVDESSLTGESNSVSKNAEVSLSEKTHLAERVNMIYAGTCVVSGNGEMIVTCVGDNTQMGMIAGELQVKNIVSAPLNEKLSKLSKSITIMGIFSAFIVFIMSIIKLAVQNNLRFESITNALVDGIILIVASVPEGLPATVAISLTLNVLKLSKSNALIKKMIATETVGCVSVICSDKTGTLTQNKMVCEKIHLYINKPSVKEHLNRNILINNSCDVINSGGTLSLEGTPTEKALIKYLKGEKSSGVLLSKIPFTSEKKFMSSVVDVDGEKIEYFKGAPEVIVGFCGLENFGILDEISILQKKGRRCIAFCHKVEDKFYYDGYASIVDPIRPDVKKSVKDCERAGIKVKILTGDNEFTASAVASELGIAVDGVFNADVIEEMGDEELKKKLPTITVISRSTPLIKLRIVKLLKELGEVVAVTGDGINDAPAMKQADIGIAMGSGSEITKEAGDIILLDDSFSTIIKAINFGRSIFRNFQRFIMFQLTVNISAVSIIIICSFLGLDSPFTSLQLLWLNIIMDGPPALSLAMESARDEYMTYPPVKRGIGIINKRVLFKIVLNAIVICFIVLMQYEKNFLGANLKQRTNVTFSLFSTLQIFNSFNCKELGLNSSIKHFFSNKLMVVSMSITLVCQIIISECTKMFSPVPLGVDLWLKIIGLSLTVILFSECYKLLLRLIKNNIQNLHKNSKVKKV